MKNEQELKEILGYHIKVRRENRNWTQEELAVKARVTKNAICDIEAGHKFARAKTLVRLANAFGTEVYELLKPKNVCPDNPSDLVTLYGEEVREAIEEINYRYNVKNHT
ncbi:MAG: helix-turn-helix transcriptional regulator [Treponema sp.]|jgi:transcriptional regulator with XRE-family HTH domain|nr:helix-turn-helix transcriptional regulator [Treponema sp.]